MKKILLSVALLAACGMATAQKLTYVPYATLNNSSLAGTATSANGRYIGGGNGEYAFICDMQTLETKYFISDELGSGEDESATSDIYAISDDGVGYGYVAGIAAKFSFADHTIEKIVDDNSIAKWTTADGSTQIGVKYDNSYSQFPVIWKDGELANLPVPTESTMGFYVNGAIANVSNADGSIIVGSVQDDMAAYPMLIWNLNADGKTYSVNPMCKRFFNPTFDSWQPYDMFEGAAISSNGKWIAMNIHNNMPSFDDPDTGMRLARYDVEADTLQFIDCPDAGETYYYYANGIADDGTIVGYVENEITQGCLSMICQAGSTKAEYMKDVYPEVKDIATMDGYELNVPCAITPDGRYIMGYGYVLSPLDEDDVWYATWQLDRGEQSTGVEETVASNAPKKVVASYDLEGKKLNLKSNKRGIVINRLSNGKTVKNLVK